MIKPVVEVSSAAAPCHSYPAMAASLKTAVLVACLALAQGALLSKPLTPQKFLEDNKDAFSIIHTATARVGYLGGFLAGLQGDS